MNKAIQDILKSIGMYRIWIYQAYYNLTAKYKRTIFGSLWMALLYGVYTITISVVWGALFGRDLQKVLPHVMIGYLGISVVLTFVLDGPEVLLSNGGIIKNHAYPRNYFVLEVVARACMTFLHNLPIAYIAILVVGALKVPNWTIILSFPLVVFTVAIWTMLIAMASARYRDLRFLLPQLGQSLMLLSPVYWDESSLHSKTWIVDYNPVAALLSLIRQPIVGMAPTSIEWSVSLAFCLLGVILYAIFFPMFRRRIPFWL